MDPSKVDNSEREALSHFHLVNDMDVGDVFDLIHHSLYMNLTFEEPFVFAFGKIDATTVKNVTDTFKSVKHSAKTAF